MPSRAEVLRDRTIGGEGLLRVPWGLESLHAPLPLAGRLMGILRTVVQIAVLLIPPALYQDVEHIPLLIYGPPEVIAFPVDRQEHFIHMPRVTGLRPPTPERIRRGLAELAAPLPNRLIRHDDAPGEEEFLHVAVAETEPEIEPNAMADDRDREAVVLRGVG